MKVLFAERDASVRRAVCQILESYGYDVKEVGSVATAVQALNQENFAVVLMDYSFPDNNGRDILLAAKEKSISVIVTTAGCSENLAEMGFDEVLKKVYKADDLLRLIRKITG